MRTRAIERRRTVVRWIVQGQLALVLLGVGGTKCLTPGGAARSDLVPRGIGVAEMAAGLAIVAGSRRQPFARSR